MQPQATSTEQSSQPEAMPGDLAVWIFICIELSTFAVFFVVFAITRLNHPEVFSEGYEHLNRTAGLINTIALITSSYFVVRAVMAMKANDGRACSRWLNWGLVGGAVYVVVKLAEYIEAFGAGYDLDTNKFYTFYFLLTFFHFAHVLLGMVILAIMSYKARRGRYGREELYIVESGASYWHMVDLLWIVLFPLVYVIH